MCRTSSGSNQRARKATNKFLHRHAFLALKAPGTVRSLGAPPVGARMQPDGMPSVSGMHRTHALCVVRSGERVWVRESMLTSCAD